MTWIYSTCWDLCPAEAAEIVEAMNRVGDDRVAFYIVSVDPVGDVPRRVRKWLAVRNLLDRPVHYLMGSREELAPVWQAYGIVPVNASDEEAAAAAKFADEFRAQAAKEGLDLASRPYERPERPAPPSPASGEEPQHARPVVPGPHAARRRASSSSIRPTRC